MDIYSFFNSPDVAEHCRSIGHMFNAFESAVIINQCYTKPFEEKLAAYKAIVNEYPDMEVPETLQNKRLVPSFHKVLGDIIEYEEQKLKVFMECEASAIYRVILNNKNQEYSHHPSEVFSSCKKALSHALEYLNDMERAEEFEFLSKFLNIDIRKLYIDSKNHYWARLSKSGDIVNLESYLPAEDEDPTHILDCYINVPVPFKKGDLVEYIGERGFMGSLYVLQSLSCDSEHHENRVMNMDTSDMTAHVYYLNDDVVNCETQDFYPNLQYCRRELEGEERILKFVSLYMQEKICLCELLGIQRFLLADKLRSAEAEHAIKWNTNLDEPLKKLLLVEAQKAAE